MSAGVHGSGPVAAEGAGAAQTGKVRRPRAPRTVAAAVVATVLLVVAGALLYDVIAVRTGHRARPWRAELADELATRHLDDPAVLVGAGAGVLLGALLLGLALAPGLRRWLPLRPHGATAAAVDRAGVAALLADRAAVLPGVEHLRVRVGRRRVRIALTGPADPASVQRRLREELAAVTLARPPRLDVRTAGRRGRARPQGEPGPDADTGREPGRPGATGPAEDAGREPGPDADTGHGPGPAEDAGRGGESADGPGKDTRAAPGGGAE
ncbi:DUF6286 domain-containing protein [Kitasatospora sp. NPDC015120]|uniref:DUF6286 domain-containing protein n=1 Tax=Kitasatospora sp. NPDC015120 TaxID=3364023 RepID=UPI0036F4772D